MKNKSQKLNTKYRTPNAQRGFTLLFATLVSALVIAVGAAIIGITLKQVTLSSAGKATQQAFYSADTGMECALYLDRGGQAPNCKLGFFPSPKSVEAGQKHPGASSCVDDDPKLLAYAKCLGKYVGDDIDSNVYVDPTNGDVTTRFTLDNNTPDSDDASGGAANHDNMCFSVAVTKKSPTDAILPNATIIESRGYNTCDENAQNRFERAIRSVNQ